MSKKFSNWFAILICVCASSTLSLKNQPRIMTRNGHLTIWVDNGKDINLQVSGDGRVNINNQDVLKIVNSVKNVSNLIDSLTKNKVIPTIPSYVNWVTQSWSPDITQRIDIIESNINNHTTRSNLEFFRIKRRLNMLQRNVRNIITSLSTNECDTNPCLNGGTCQDLYKSYSCMCTKGWEGPSCERDVNECSIFAGSDLGCQNGATCINKPGTYECVCAVGFHGLHCTTKSVDCYTAGKDLCGHGSCVPQATGYKCFCDQGWTTDGKNPACSTDVDECASNHIPCSTNPLVQCINVPGSFYCGHCPLGYTGTGYYCNDIDECQLFNGGCSMNPMVQCTNTPGSRSCGLCPPGYIGNGITCTYQGSVCGTNNGGCHPLAQCRDNPRISSSYVECICPAGYIGNGYGPNGCVQSGISINRCDPNPCVYGTCSISNTTNDYVCSCRIRYTGRNCDIKKNPCISNPCLNGATCIDVLSLSYRCKCTSGFTGNNCQIEKQACGGKLEGYDGVLQFPTDQTQQYSHGVSCAWQIQTNSTKVLNITFTKFDIEDSTDCQFDWVQIHDGKNSAAQNIGRFCGSQLPKGGKITTTTNFVYIWFRSDRKLAKGGFSLNWTTSDPVCGGKIRTSTYGTIASPGYPGNYPLNRDCYWELITDRSKRFEFHFFTLMIGQSANCTGDSLEFYYESVKKDNRFAQYCTSGTPAPLTSPSRSVYVYFHSNNNLSYTGFQISYKVISGVPSCGGTFTAGGGQIGSPTVSSGNGYRQFLECEYKIVVANQLRVKLEFTSIKLLRVGPYCSEYISLYDGPTTESRLVAKYCGDTIPPVFTSTTNEVFLLYKGVYPNTFSIRYETVCGRKYTASTGVISSSDYPNMERGNLDCLYEIEQAPGTAITVNVIDYRTLYGLSRIGLKVLDGTSKSGAPLGSYSSLSNFPATVVSTHNYVTVTVGANWPFRRKYYLNYTTTELGCGGIYTKKMDTIHTPNHPDLYSNELSCTWLIEAPEKFVIQLSFLNFKLESSYACIYDYVAIYDVNNAENKEPIGKFCGSKTPPVIITGSNIMKVVFKADSSHRREGFLASYVFHAEDSICGGTYYTSAGVIKSPKYPKPYPAGRDCTWIIHVPPGRQIMLNVTDFHLEGYSNCRYDFLEIRHGATASSPLIGKFCSDKIDKVIYSHANQLYLHFKADLTRSAKGFLIYWSSAVTGCGGVLTSPTGSIISPHYPEPYSKHAECVWTISVNFGSIIQVMFTDLDLETHHSCHLDYVEIFDGNDVSATSLGRYCSSHPPYLRSTSNHLMIKFRSDVSIQGRGFQLRYHIVCENTVTGYSGVIESPNFPNRYLSNENCSWTIGVTEGNKINIVFSHFELERSALYGDLNCSYDYVEIKYTDRDTDTEVKSAYCGSTIPPPITTNSNTTKINFVSDHLLAGNGFRLEWQIVGCGGVLTHPKGTFQSPNYPNHYPSSTRCDWIIEAPYGNVVNVTFDKLDIEPTETCNYDYIRLYDGRDDQANLMNQFCHTNKPITVTSTGHVMLVRFDSDSVHEGIGFEGKYEAVPAKCGGIISASQGQFTSPHYPKNYDAGSVCEWLIEIEQNHVIELNFLDVDLVRRANQTYIKVYDGPSSAYTVLAFLQGDTTPNDTFRSTYNHLFVEMVTSNRTYLTAKGFKASYKTACGAILNSETNGIIDYNPVHTYYGSQCEWTIMAPDPTQHVYLTISLIKGYYCELGYYYIFIYDGFNSTSPKRGQYCSSIPPMLVSTGHVFHIVAQIGFKATYSTLSTACGGTLEHESGYFATPNYPDNYPADIECEWIVNIGDSVTTTLAFSTFELVNSADCNNDFLEIRKNNGSGALQGVYCGTNAPSNITLSGRIWIYFKSSKPDVGEIAVTAKGFKAQYILNDHTELTDPSGTLYSPLYPTFYTKTGQFSWRITVKFGYRIAINIKELFMEFGDDEYCFSASLSFYDGYNAEAPLLHRYCSATNRSFKSTSNVVYIVAAIDYTRRGSKFAVEWLEVENVKNNTIDRTNNCGTTDVININPIHNYTLKSPGYPGGYNNSLNCVWIFSTVPENHLEIDFMVMDLEYRIPCLFDRVEIYSGRDGTEDWQLVKKACMSNDTHDTIETTNLMKVVFKTDSYRNATGFHALVTETCGGYVQQTNGVISVTNSSFSSMFGLECQWNISVRSGRTMRIKFLTFDIGNNKDSKCNNYILLKNGKSADSPMLGDGKYCGDTTPSSLETTSNHLYVKFSTKNKVRGFTMEYNEVAVDCDARITLSRFDNTTYISSPNFPNIPLPHTECEWIISTIAGESLQIDFIERFDLTYTLECYKEYVEIRNGGTVLSPLLGKYCDSMPGTIVTTGNMIFVKFFTDVEEPRNGFKAKVSIAKCGGTIINSTGEIKSRYFNNKKLYPKNENCSWEIDGPEGHSIIFTFQTIDLGQSNCVTDYVEIFEHSIADFNNITSIGRYCNGDTPEIRVLSNKVLVRFISGSRNTYAAGFLLKFRSAKEKCGGKLNTDFGYITSPRYPVMFPTKCEWVIKVTKGRRIQVEILDLDFDTTQPSHGLVFSNAENFISHIKFVKAGDNVKYINSTDNTLSIFFWSLFPSNHRGFKLKYTSDQPSLCTGDFSLTSGIISSPENLTYYHCSWQRVETNINPMTLALRIAINSNNTNNKNKNDDDIPSSVRCQYVSSRIKLTSEDTLELGTVCAASARNTIIRSPFAVNELTANQASRSGFNFTVKYQKYNCGGIITSVLGNITSPGFPKRTSDVVECVWFIKVPKEQTIKLKFDSLDLGEDCAKSYLIIYNGKLNSSPRLGKFCRQTYQQTLQSQHHEIWLEYHSETSAGKGFNITYESAPSGCGGIFHETTRLIQSPNYPDSYPNNAECVWEVRADEGHHIGLEFFDRFQLEKSDGCKNDFVEVWDYKNDAWNSLGRMCGREHSAFLNSSSTQMKIMFRSNEKTTGTGFKAKWSLNCGGIFIATRSEQYIRSPGYPNSYQNYLDCVYNISAPGKDIAIKFYDFHLEQGAKNCLYDSLTVTYRTYGMLTKRVYCGTNKPADFYARNEISFRFKTDMYITKPGFVFSYAIDGCGADITEPTEINQPTRATYLPMGFTRTYLCIWNITAPKNKIVAVRFDKLAMSGSRYCWYNSIGLYNGFNTSSVNRLGRLCGNLTKTAPVFKSTDNGMIIQYKAFFTSKNIFKAIVYFTYGPKSGCGGYVTLDTTSKKYIETPNLQGQLDCQWIIQAPDDYYISLDIKKLPNCQQGIKNSSAQLEIRDGASHFSELLIDVCRNVDTLRKFSTSGSQSFVQWSTLNNKLGENPKFKIELSVTRSQCGLAYLMANESLNYLTSPYFPQEYPGNMKCVWKINATRAYRHLHFKFISFDLGENANNSEECTGDRIEIVDKHNRQVIDEGLGADTVYYFGKKGLVHKDRREPLGVHQYCGQTATNFDYYSAEGNVVVTLYSGGGRHGKGFKLAYSTVGLCRNYSSSQGRLYSNNITTCDFRITTPINTTISLYFNNFGMGSGEPDCSNAKMEIFDGKSDNATKLGKFCQYIAPNPVFSSQNELFIRIVKPRMYYYGHYDITFTSTTEGKGCGGQIYNYRGMFTSPLYPNNYREMSRCVWEVTVPYGLRVSMKFTVFDINASCSSDYLVVKTYQEGYESSQKFCNDDTLPEFESANKIVVEYQTSFNNGGTGWVANFRAFGEDNKIQW